MVYWIVVLTLWFGSIFLLAFGGAQLLEYLKGEQINLYLAVGSFIFGIFLNFLVVNWPVEVTKPTLDKKTLKALKYMAKVAPLAPKAVKEGLEKLVQKYS